MGILMDTDTLRRELRDTISSANKIVEFYEEVMAAQARRITSLDADRSALQMRLGEALSLLRAALRTPLHPIN